MKKNMTRIIALVLVILLGLVGIVAAAIELIATAGAEGMTRDAYTFNIDVMEQLDAARVEQTIRFTNRTGQQLDELLLSLYPNAYRRQATAPFEMEIMQSAYPEGFTPGGADFFLMELDGQACDWGVIGQDEAALRIECDLAPGQSCTLRFGYELLLPKCNGIYGVSSLSFKLIGFYPMLAPWDPDLQEFSLVQALPVGECRHSDPADYSATLDLPKNCQVASVGKVTKSDGGARDSWMIKADGVRELPIVIGQQYKAFERQAGTMAITAYMTDGGMANYALDVAAQAVRLFEGKLGALEKPLTLAQTNLVGASASRSGLILVDDSLIRWNKRDELEYELALNIAKQYFGEMVGNHPAREPWLSEAIPSYLALYYIQQTYGQARFLQELNTRVLPALQLTLPGNVRVDSASSQFGSQNEYEIVLRNRGAAAMYEISVSTGEDVFLDVLEAYAEQNRGRVASLPDFAAALNQVSGRDLSTLLLEMLQNVQEHVSPSTGWYE